jgi:hypothetical protein
MWYGASALAGIAILVSIGANAQGLGGAGPNALPENLDPAMCDQLAAIPNAPMSPEACRSMMGMAKSMQAASSDPSAMRSGDGAMTCEQIIAEMRTTTGPMVSEATAAQSKAAGDATLALMEKQNAEAKAFMAQQMALGLGASALGLVPGGGIAGAAIAKGQQAQAQAFAQKQATEAAPVRAQMNQSLTAVGGEMGQAIQSNPRFARLAQLLVDKNCPPPADAAK